MGAMRKTHQVKVRLTETDYRALVTFSKHGYEGNVSMAIRALLTAGLIRARFLYPPPHPTPVRAAVQAREPLPFDEEPLPFDEPPGKDESDG